MVAGSRFLSEAAAMAADEPPVAATNWHILLWAFVFGLLATAALLAFTVYLFRI